MYRAEAWNTQQGLGIKSAIQTRISASGLDTEVRFQMLKAGKGEQSGVTQHVRTGGRGRDASHPWLACQQPPGFSLFPSEPNALHLDTAIIDTHPGRRGFHRMILWGGTPLGQRCSWLRWVGALFYGKSPKWAWSVHSCLPFFNDTWPSQSTDSVKGSPLTRHTGFVTWTAEVPLVNHSRSIKVFFMQEGSAIFKQNESQNQSF